MGAFETAATVAAVALAAFGAVVWSVRLASFAGRRRREKDAWPVPVDAVPLSADDLLNYLARHRDEVSLVAYEIGRPSEGIRINPRIPRPDASVRKIILLAEYARQVDAGQINPEERVSLPDLRAWFLPWTDGRAHPTAIHHLKSTRRVSADGTVSLDDVVHAMVRFSANSAADYLLSRLGADPTREMQRRILPHSDLLPVPSTGEFLLWFSCLRRHPHANDCSESLRAVSPSQYAKEASDLGTAYATRPGYRFGVRVALYLRGIGGGPPALARIADASAPTGTAEDYARVMEGVCTGAFISENVSRIMARHLEWPLEKYPSHRRRFARLGTKSGSMPGVLASAWFAATALDAGKDRTVALSLMISRMPLVVWRALTHSFIHQQLEFLLLENPDFFIRARALLNTEEESGSEPSTAEIQRTVLE